MGVALIGRSQSLMMPKKPNLEERETLDGAKGVKQEQHPTKGTKEKGY